MSCRTMQNPQANPGDCGGIPWHFIQILKAKCSRVAGGLQTCSDLLFVAAIGQNIVWNSGKVHDGERYGEGGQGASQLTPPPIAF